MRRRHRASALVAVLITMAMFMALAEKPQEPIRVTVSPQIGIAPLRVTVRVSVFQGVDPNFTCPAVSILWPDGSESKAESDCDPADPEFDPFVRTRTFGFGPQEVIVRVRQNGKERVFRQTVQVIG